MKFILYIKNDCDYCIEAVKELKIRNIDFDIFVMERHFSMWPELKKIYNWDTVPMIFEVPLIEENDDS